MADSAMSASQDSGTSRTVNDVSVMAMLTLATRTPESATSAVTTPLVQIVPCKLGFCGDVKTLNKFYTKCSLLISFFKKDLMHRYG